MKKLSNVSRAAAQHPRSMARIVLALVASVLVALLATMGISAGPNGHLLFAQEESPSPTAEPTTGPAIQLLNPNETNDPVIGAPGETPERPKISDRYDGTDTAYHVVAVTRDEPADAIVEAYWQPDGGNEMTVGPLTRVAGSDDTWELFWDIPADWSEGDGNFIVRLFRPGGTTPEKIAEDTVAAELRHEGTYSGGDDQPAENTVEIVWPSNAGQFGFHKPKGGQWRGYMEGTSSGEFGPGGSVIDSTVRVRLFYTVTPIGQDPKFKECGEADPGNRKEDGTETWAANCTLGGKDLPSQVTAVAAVGTGFDRPIPSGFLVETTTESADAHRVLPYVQDVRRMNVAITGVPPSSSSATYPTGQRRTADSDCLEFDVTVTDHLDRPVQGANVDIHLKGPSDEAGFGDEGSSSHGSSTEKAPDAGTHTKEQVWDCDSPGNRWEDEQGDHDVPDGTDIKHIESTNGTGLSGPSGIRAGQFRFHVYSPDPGRSRITAWVDDAPLANEGETRAADNDRRDSAEPAGSIIAQWFPEAMTASISPRADSAVIGECNRYVMRVRAGNAVVRNINVDVHASGPTNDLDFCDPGDGTPRRAPDQPEGDNAHAPEDEGESSHPSDDPEKPQVQHTEGETDTNGNFVFGITSPVTGSTQIEAWVDGEKDQDNDVKNSGEVSATATKNWAGSAHDAEVRFVNPSGYGGAGDAISNKQDADGFYHLVARVDLPDVIEGVEFFLMDGEVMVRDLGDGSRVGTTDAWELYTTMPDGDYTLRAQIINTSKREDRDVVVDNTLETAELTRPANGAGAPFSNKETVVAGVASADAEGVEFYYTKTDARVTRNAAQWISCGETELPTAEAPQPFEGKCTLAEGDAALDVTGIAALTWVCDPLVGCSLERTYQTGDAHRVFGFEENPSVTIQPAEASKATGKCQRFELTVTDAAGSGIPNANVDIHLTGPKDGAKFCDAIDSSPRRAPTTGGHAASTDDESAMHQNEGADTHHTEGESGEGGKFVFGVRSGAVGDSRVVGWADQNDNDELDADEKSDSSVVHWGSGGGGGNRTCTHRGDAGDNTIVGTPGDDVICAGRGKDVIRGRGGDDIIRGGRGNDDIRGNAGRDTLIGGRGLDVIRGGRGSDVARGNSGNDTLRGFTGADRLFGGDNDDVISGGDHNDYLRGNRGRDLISGGPGRDNCGGGPGRDKLTRCE